MLWFLIYAVVAIVVFLLGRSILREEPTAHGQITGGCILVLFTLFWPIALCGLIAVGCWRLCLAAKAFARDRWQRWFGDQEGSSDDPA